jgi:hypothetical protein
MTSSPLARWLTDDALWALVAGQARCADSGLDRSLSHRLFGRALRPTTSTKASAPLKSPGLAV